MTNKKRGRPRKNFPRVELNLADHPSDELSAKISAAVKSLPCTASLSPGRLQQLVSDSIDAAGFYSSMKKVRKTMSVKTRGNRPNVHRQVLIKDCQRAWETATGKPAALWEVDDSHMYGSQASPAIEIAKAIESAIVGKPTQSSRRQIPRVKEIKYVGARKK